VRHLGHFDPDFTTVGQTISERLDHDEVRTTLDVSYRLLGLTRLTLDARAGSIDFHSLDPFGRTKDSRDWAITPGVRFGEGADLTGWVRFGWAATDAREADRPDFTDLVGETELTYRPGRTHLALHVRREPGYAVSGGNVYLLDTRATVGVVHYLNPTFGIETATTAGRLTFPGSAEDGPPREDRVRRYEAGVRMRLAHDRLGRRLVYKLRVVRDSNDSNLPGLYRSRTTIDLGVELGFF
jgi:hypothetical protein